LGLSPSCLVLSPFLCHRPNSCWHVEDSPGKQCLRPGRINWAGSTLDSLTVDGDKPSM
jgi:hypothetical protein